MTPPYNLIVRSGQGGEPYYEVKWRSGGRQLKRRLGPAWLTVSTDGSWSPRSGRLRSGFLDERLAHERACEAITAVANELAAAAAAAREKAERGITVRELAREWLEWQREVKQVKPATLVDYGAILR